MKYKDRISAKRRFKQAVLIAATTITLGLSAAGGTTSAFAEETSTQKFEISPDGSIKILENNPTLQNLVTDLSGPLFKEAVLTGNSSIQDLQNLGKHMALASTGLLPFGGSFVYEFISAVWPEAGPSQMDLIMKTVPAMIDEKISQYDLDSIQSDMETLRDELKIFERSINNAPKNIPDGAQASPGDILRSNQELAKDINRLFKSLINTCRKSGQKEAELPFYTVIATSHLQFLKFMELNAQSHPRLKMEPGVLDQLFSEPLKVIAQNYKKHIDETSQSAQKKIYSKMNSIIDVSINPLESLDHMYVPRGVPTPNYNDKKIEELKTEYTNLFNNMHAYAYVTENNEAFKIISESIIGKEMLHMGSAGNVNINVRDQNGLAKYLTAKSDLSQVHCEGRSAGSEQEFMFESVNAEENIFALKSIINGHYATFDYSYKKIPGLGSFDATDKNDKRTHVKLISLGDNKYAMRSIYDDNNFIYADFNHGGALTAHSKYIGDWEKFEIRGAGGNSIASSTLMPSSADLYKSEAYQYQSVLPPEGNAKTAPDITFGQFKFSPEVGKLNPYTDHIYKAGVGEFIDVLQLVPSHSQAKTSINLTGLEKNTKY
ncbi:TPA: hypothetical protein ROY17_005692, partial [Bacillus thuringiensis]|nr:hypothetical protein [Bacillus thuringiensis]